MRIAGAPVSWGVSEVPGWGHQLGPERVLTEMRQVGLEATEFGPDGFLPADPAARGRVLAGHGLRAVGGFVPVVLHRPDSDPVAGVQRVLDAFVAADAEVVVLAASSGLDGYDARPDLDATGWATLNRNLDRLAGLARSRGLTPCLHPHVGTMVETPADVARVMAGSSVPLCLDTGHLLIGGGDPVRVARDYAERIVHVHVKDVDAALAARVRSGELPFRRGVDRGVFVPLGKGDVDFGAIVTTLRAAGYDGWYVLEQDTIVHAEPAPGTGPVENVRTSIGYLARLG